MELIKKQREGEKGEWVVKPLVAESPLGEVEGAFCSHPSVHHSEVSQGLSTDTEGGEGPCWGSLETRGAGTSVFWGLPVGKS